jgi:divalent metal cation (Fe/Co/Zn/Cd) transporter
VVFGRVMNAEVYRNIAYLSVVLLTGSRFPDLIVGSAIGVYVVKEAFEILSEAREARAGENCCDDH